MGAIPSKDNGFIIIGGRQNDKKKTETFVFKIDGKLNIVWKKQLRTVPFVFALPLLKERPDGKVVVGYTYKKDENSKFQIGLKLLDFNGTIVQEADI